MVIRNVDSGHVSDANTILGSVSLVRFRMRRLWHRCPRTVPFTPDSAFPNRPSPPTHPELPTSFQFVNAGSRPPRGALAPEFSSVFLDSGVFIRYALLKKRSVADRSFLNFLISENDFLNAREHFEFKELHLGGLGQQFL